MFSIKTGVEQHRVGRRDDLDTRRKIVRTPLLLVLVLLACSGNLCAQQNYITNIPTTDALPVAQVQPTTATQEEDVFASDATAAAAEEEPEPDDNFEITYGFNQRFSPRNEDDGPKFQRAPLEIDFFAGRYFLGIGIDTVSSIIDSDGNRVTGVGDLSLTGIYTLLSEDDQDPVGLNLLYSLKLPTGRASKGLSSGRKDHTVLGLLSRNFGGKVEGGDAKRNMFEVDFGGFFGGRPEVGGWAMTGLINLVYERRFGFKGKHKFHIETDWAARTEDVPADVTAINWFRFQLSRHTSLKLGTQVGITPNSSRFGFFASFGVNGNLRQVFKGK